MAARQNARPRLAKHPGQAPSERFGLVTRATGRPRSVRARSGPSRRAISSLLTARGCGGIGRRARFRSVSRQLGGGSSPLIRIVLCVGTCWTTHRSGTCAQATHVRIPRGGGGMTVTALALSGAQPAGGQRSANTHTTNDPVRAALGAINPAQPSCQSCSPTRWNADHVRRSGEGADSPASRSRSRSLRSASCRSSRHSWWS